MPSQTESSVAQRKQLLLAQSALFRAEISNGKSIVLNGLSTESIVQSAFSHLGSVAIAAFKSRSGIGLGGGNVIQTLAPLVLRAIAMLSAKRLLKPVLRGALIAGSVATVVAIVAHKKKASAAESIHDDSTS